LELKGLFPPRTGNARTPTEIAILLTHGKGRCNIETCRQWTQSRAALRITGRMTESHWLVRATFGYHTPDRS